MKSLLFLFVTGLISSLPFNLAQNVAMSSSRVAVATSSATGGLLTRLGEQESLFDTPEGVSAFTDVSIDADNENLVFALSVSPPQVCSYSHDGQTDGSLSLINCAGASFATSPFYGISAIGGTLTISGGTGGVTVFDYDSETGTLNATPRLLNVPLNVIGNPDVLMITPTQAAFSSDIGGSPRFGTLVAELSSDNTLTTAVIRNPNSSGFDNTIGPSNFPFVNAIYSGMWLYTANGGMSLANLDTILSSESTGIEIPAPDASFQAVTCAVNSDQAKLVFGGLLGNGQSVIYTFDISNPENPALLASMEVNGRITSVASSGNVVSYVVQGGDTIQAFEMDSMPPLAAPTDDAATPTMSPTIPSTTPMGDSATSSGAAIPRYLTIAMFACLAIVGLI